MTETRLSSLAADLGAALYARNWKLVTAESCTGGWISVAVTDVAGSSDWFDRGFVTYSDAAKAQMLGVSTALLETHGAVSEPVVRAMAEGALQRSDARVAVAVSGVAGPGGGSADKPVGLVWIAWSVDARTWARSFRLPGDRHDVRLQSVKHALWGLLERVADA